MENNVTTVTDVIPVTNIPKNKPKNSRTGRYLPVKNPTPRHEAVKTLLDHSSLTQVQIAEQLNYKPEYIRELKKKLGKTSIVTAKRLRKAYKVVDNILDQKPLEIEKVVNGEIQTIKDYPSHSVALDAAKRVIDQHQPIVQRHQTESVNINLDGTLLDYSQFTDR